MPRFSVLALTMLAPVVLASNEPTSIGEWAIVDHKILPYLGSSGKLEIWKISYSSKPKDIITFVYGTISASSSQVSINFTDRLGATSSVYSSGLCDKSLVVANGNFFKIDGDKKSPLGLLVVNSKIVSKTSNRTTGGFLYILRSGIVSIGRRADARIAASAHYALESSPILIYEGSNAMKRDDGVRFDRVAIGKTQGGDFVVAGVFGENQRTMSLDAFSRLALAAGVKRGSRIDSLIAMDGGPSAHIWFPKANALFGSHGPTYLPSAVCIEGR